MSRHPIFPLAAAVCCSLSLVTAVSAAEVDSDSVYCFSPEDFSSETSITGICITDLPETQGTILLGDRIVRTGDILTADQVAHMTFSPAGTETDKTAQVGYLPIFEDRVAENAVMTIGIRGKVDQAPVAEDSALETYKNLAVSGKLKVSDPEGQPLTFNIVRGAKRGDVAISEDGSFTYTPKKNKIGVDSFVYTAVDPAGKISREATVTITILKPTDAPQYTDTLGKDCRFAAEWMKHTGIFVGETLGDSTCFSPDKEVTRGEFVTMLVKTLDIPTDADLVYTGYQDEIPKWLQPYLAAAMRSGLTAGLPDSEVFRANEPITGAEASVMIQNALDLHVPTTSEEASVLPVWAQDAAAALGQQGIDLNGEAILTRGVAAQVLYQVNAIGTKN